MLQTLTFPPRVSFSWDDGVVRRDPSSAICCQESATLPQGTLRCIEKQQVTAATHVEVVLAKQIGVIRPNVKYHSSSFGRVRWKSGSHGRVVFTFTRSGRNVCVNLTYS